jgi:hypothetical protein
MTYATPSIPAQPTFQKRTFNRQSAKMAYATVFQEAFSEGKSIFFQSPEREKDLCNLAWALTIHKSQGHFQSPEREEDLCNVLRLLIDSLHLFLSIAQARREVLPLGYASHRESICLLSIAQARQ